MCPLRQDVSDVTDDEIAKLLSKALLEFLKERKNESEGSDDSVN